MIQPDNGPIRRIPPDDGPWGVRRRVDVGAIDGVILDRSGTERFGRGMDGGGTRLLFDNRCGIIIPSPLLRVRHRSELTRVRRRTGGSGGLRLGRCRPVLRNAAKKKTRRIPLQQRR